MKNFNIKEIISLIKENSFITNIILIIMLGFNIFYFQIQAVSTRDKALERVIDQIFNRLDAQVGKLDDKISSVDTKLITVTTNLENNIEAKVSGMTNQINNKLDLSTMAFLTKDKPDIYYIGSKATILDNYVYPTLCCIGVIAISLFIYQGYKYFNTPVLISKKTSNVEGVTMVTPDSNLIKKGTSNISTNTESPAIIEIDIKTILNQNMEKVYNEGTYYNASNRTLNGEYRSDRVTELPDSPLTSVENAVSSVSNVLESGYLDTSILAVQNRLPDSINSTVDNIGNINPVVISASSQVQPLVSSEVVVQAAELVTEHHDKITMIYNFYKDWT